MAEVGKTVSKDTTPTDSNGKKSGADEIRAAADKLKSQTTEGIATLAGTVAAVVEGVETRQTAIDGKQTGIENRLKNQEGLGGKLKGNMDTLDGTVAEARKEMLEIDQHVHDVSRAISDAEENVGKCATKASVDELRGQVETVETNMGKLQQDVNGKLTQEEGDTRYLEKGAIESLEGRCAGVEAALEEMKDAAKKDGSAPAEVEEQLKPLKEEIAGIRTTIEGLRSDIHIKETLDVAGGLEAVKRRLDAIEKGIKETPQPTVNTDGLKQEIRKGLSEDFARQLAEAIDSAVPTIIKKVTEALATRAAAVDIDAIEGKVYAAVLDAIKGIAQDSANLQEFGEAIGEEAETARSEQKPTKGDS